MAVKLTSQVTLPSTLASPANLQTRARFWTKLDLEIEQHARRDRSAEFRVLDRHEIDELARAGEAEAFHREHACGLRQRFDLEHAGHDRRAGEMALEEVLVEADRLDRVDAFVGDQFLDPVDQEQGRPWR